MSKYDLLWQAVRQSEADTLTLTLEEAARLAGVPIDHSFLTFKRELSAYGYSVKRVSLKAQTLTFERLSESNRLILYVHGKGGSPAECAHYRPLFPGCHVVGLEYQASTPWEAREELPAALKALARPNDRVTLIANSIGAFLSLCALPTRRIEKAYFISPSWIWNG